MYAPTLEQILTEAGVLPEWAARWETRGEEKGKAEGKSEERKIWLNIVADKDTKLADKDAEIARLRAQLEKKEAAHTSNY